MLLYPNPAKNFIIIDIPGATGVYTVFVYDYAGRMKINAELTRNELTISGLDDGLYYLKIRAQNSIYSGTFLKI